MSWISNSIQFLAVVHAVCSLPSAKDQPMSNCGGPDTQCHHENRCTKPVYKVSSSIGQHTNDPCRKLSQVCCRQDDVVMSTVSPMVSKPDDCGYRNTNGLGTQVDKEAQYAEFPWMVAIIRRDKDESEMLDLYMCGGSLISPKVVLTAAHCVHGKDPHALKVRAGEWDRKSTNEPIPHQDRNVTEIVIHKEYKKGGLLNDVALLVLETPVQFADNVKTICLPLAHREIDFSNCIATGWGQNSKNGSFQAILKKVRLPVVPRRQCLESLQATRLGEHFKLHTSFICAGGEVGRDMCKGDGGSPLVCPISADSDQYQQVGIVSWGIGCGGAVPGVYASVMEFRSWIDEQLTYRGIDNSYYLRTTDRHN